MAAAGRRVVALGGKGSTLTSSAVFDVASGGASVTIDSSALSRRSSSSNSAAEKFAFTIPSYFSAEEARASLILLLNKLLLSSSPSAAAQLLEILENGVHSPDYTLNDVASADLALLDYPAAAIDGVSTVMKLRADKTPLMEKGKSRKRMKKKLNFSLTRKVKLSKYNCGNLCNLKNKIIAI